MMNLIELQDKLKGLSQDQLVRQMQMPTGEIPQFLLLSEITRRKKMESEFEGRKAKDDTSVAQDMMAVSGMPGGFAGQMAGAMAPQTDTAMNDAAVPQQMAPPRVQSMAEGGIVALQEGGPVSGRRPRLVVSGGKQFIEMPDGSLIEPGLLGFTSSDEAVDYLSGRNVGYGETEGRFREDIPPSVGDQPLEPRLATAGDGQPTISQSPSASMPSRLPPMAQIYDAAQGPRATNPSYSESDRRDVFPGANIPIFPPTGIAQPRDPRRTPTAEETRQVTNDMFNMIGSVITPPLQALDQSWLGQMRVPAPGVPDWLQERLANATVGDMPTDYGAAGEGFPVSSQAEMRPVKGPPMAPPARDPAQAELDALIAGTPRAEGPRPFDNLFSSIAEGGRAVIENFREPEGPLDPNLGYMMGTESSNPAADAIEEAARQSAEEAAALRDEAGITQSLRSPEEVAAGAERARTAVSGAPSGGSPTGAPSGPSGGGIGAMIADGAGAPTSYEQELLNMLESREKRAQQDKWLALAQFGLQLMASDNPTVGGAIGEAGMPAIEALRSSRESYDQDRLGLLSTLEDYRMGQAQMALQRQAAAARSAAAAGGTSPSPEFSLGIDTDVNRNLTFLQSQLDAIAKAEMSSQINPVDAANRRRAIEGQIAAIYGAATGMPLGMPGSGVEYGN